ncbi:hypothetical protein K501DRAFT_141428, partial [Backusella circina FSU 941]
PSSPPLSASNTTMDDVTTIFVVGFPDDMQEREFQNMFTFSKGFEAASLKWHCKDQEEQQQDNTLTVPNSITNLMNKKQMIGFARFRTRNEASDAAEILNGKKVDIEKGSMLKAEMAKKNLHIKRGSIVPSNVVPSAVLLPEPGLSPLAGFPRRLSHPQICATLSPSGVPDYESFSPLPSDLLSPGDYKNDPFNSLFVVNINPADQNPPCNTLYVGNLPPNTSEEELKDLFISCQGYKRMSFRTKPQGPMCFVEFEDVVFATQAMNEHQGHVLSNSVKGGIRLSFSKNPLFIKPTKESGISFSFRQMGTALLADL